MVQFNEEYTLVPTELHQPINHGYGLASSQQQVLAVGVAVGTLVLGHIDGTYFKIVVLIVSVAR